MKIQSWRLVFFAAALGGGCVGKIGDVPSAARVVARDRTTGSGRALRSPRAPAGAGNAVGTGTGGPAS